MGVVDKILNLHKGGFKLGQRKYRVNLSVTRDIQLIGKATYSFLNLNEAHILLHIFLYNSHREKDRLAFMKVKHSLVSYFYKHKLMLPIVIGYFVGKKKQYSIYGIGTSFISIGKKGKDKQV